MALTQLDILKKLYIDALNNAYASDPDGYFISEPDGVFNATQRANKMFESIAKNTYSGQKRGHDWLKYNDCLRRACALCGITRSKDLRALFQ